MTSTTSDSPVTIIWILREKLSDGSEVFNVELNGEKLPANSEYDATEMAEKIADAIREHTNTDADVLFA